MRKEYRVLKHATTDRWMIERREVNHSWERCPHTKIYGSQIEAVNSMTNLINFERMNDWSDAKVVAEGKV